MGPAEQAPLILQKSPVAKFYICFRFSNNAAMAMVTSPDSKCSYQTSGKKMRRTWKSFSSSDRGDRGVSPGSPLEESSVMNDFFRQKAVEECHNYGEVEQELRGQMAEGGCSRSQMAIARDLLEQAVEGRRRGVEEEELGRMEERAMYWLLRAGEQGDGEAGEDGQADGGRREGSDGSQLCRR